MRKKLGIVLLANVAVALATCGISAAATGEQSARGASASSLSLITLPSASGIGQIYGAINGAKHSINLTMYELSDPTAEADLVKAHDRGVAVHVLLNSGYYGAGFPQDKASYSYLKAHGVSVKWTPSYFALTHQKTLTIDDKVSYILTANLTKDYYASSRDFAIVDSNASDVAAISTVFNADWSGHNLKESEPKGIDLVWSPSALSATLNLINSAKSSIDIYNEEMDQYKVVDALVAAAKRGVNVKVTMTADSSWDSNFDELAKAGVHVHLYASSASLYIHAKMILVDGVRVFLGSQNFSTSSLEDNRELGIIFSSPSIIASLSATFTSDFAKASPYDDSSENSTPPSSGSAHLTASYDASYSDWNVDVYGAAPDTTATATDGSYSGSYRTNSSGHADIYLKAPKSAQGTKVTVTVGSEKITGTL